MGRALNSNSTDLQLRKALENGDPKALEQLWDTYSAVLLAFAKVLLGSRHDAEDALHELFLRIARNRHAVAKAENLKAYLFRMLRNLALEHLRWRSKTESLSDSGSSEEEAMLVAVEASDESLAHDMEAALKSLPEEQKAVLVMKIYGDMQFNEIAEALDISQNTAASRYRYGLEKLRAFF